MVATRPSLSQEEGRSHRDTKKNLNKQVCWVFSLSLLSLCCSLFFKSQFYPAIHSSWTEPKNRAFLGPLHLHFWRFPCHIKLPLTNACLVRTCLSCSFFLLWYWSLNSGPIPWATPPPLYLWRVFIEIGFHKLFAWAGFELQSSWCLPPE
jgi:hypothetical protein